AWASPQSVRRNRRRRGIYRFRSTCKPAAAPPMRPRRASTGRMSFNTIEWQASEGVGLITLDRPKPLNAMTLEMIGELITVLDRARSDAAIRCLMITGRGRGFC